MKKKPLLFRIRWAKIGILLTIAFAAGGIGYGYWRDIQESELVEYRVEVEQGDTLWGILSKLATDKDDMSKLTWQAMQDNRISDPGHLQPGTELIIRVKKAREL